jgi:uncharacterized protein YqeY
VSVTDDLKADLIAAMRHRDKVRVSTIRSLISAIDNAGAIEVERPGFDYEPKLGLGHDLDRRPVTRADIVAIIARERQELLAARDQYLRLGQNDCAHEFDQRLQIADEYLG